MKHDQPVPPVLHRSYAPNTERQLQALRALLRPAPAAPEEPSRLRVAHAPPLADSSPLVTLSREHRRHEQQKMGA